MTLDVVVSLEKRLCEISATEPLDEKTVTDILKRLGLQKIDYNILKATKVGVTVKKVGKLSSDNTNKILVKNLVKKWKQHIPAQSNKSKLPEISTKSNTALLKRKISIDIIDLPETGNPQRDTCRKLIGTALSQEGEAYKDVVGKFAAEIESAIFNVFNGTIPAYKASIRTRRAALAQNSDLRQSIFTKTISAKYFATTKVEDLESSDLKDAREAAKKKAAFEAQYAKKQLQTTSEFICGKCKKDKCQFFEMQTRSADEPMTMYVFCCTPGCGNKWKQ